MPESELAACKGARCVTESSGMADMARCYTAGQMPQLARQLGILPAALACLASVCCPGVRRALPGAIAIASST